MKVVAVKPEDWKKLTEYVEDLKPSFYKAEKAVEIQAIFRSAIVVELQEQKAEPEVKPESKDEI